jgi:acyl-CoA synthetase (AMP-forming)/AMP-acid ligase II
MLSHPCSTTLVPTMVHALAGLKESLGYKLDSLVSVTFGGAVLTPDVLHMSISALGARGVENMFGMTEGLIIRPGNQRDVSRLLDGQEVTVGTVFAGCGIKIIDPDTNQVVPVNMLGELQGTAPSIGPYIGGISADSFSTDAEGRLWFKSGDQARMDERGRVFIMGRYKDM